MGLRTGRPRRDRACAAALALALFALPACAIGTEPGTAGAGQPAASQPSATQPSGPAPGEPPGSPPTGATTTPGSTATDAPSATTGPPEAGPEPSGDRGPGPHGVTITTPPAGVEADGPVVVLVHGGAWVAGSPGLLDAWADALAAEGAVVFNASYDLAEQPGGGDPGSVDDVACAVRFARAEAPAYTDADQLVVVGHSAGGHLGAVVALDPEPWGGDCAYPPGAPPDRFVGLAGLYDVKAAPILLFFSRFVGGTTAEEPERWAALNPVELAISQPAGLDVVLLTGSEDTLVPPSQALAFAAALPGGAQVSEIDGADHFQIQDPQVVGVDVVLAK